MAGVRREPGTPVVAVASQLDDFCRRFGAEPVPPGIAGALSTWTRRGSLDVWGWWIPRVSAALAQLPGARVTSFWRSPERNALCGGHPESQHLVGLAIDVVHPGALAAFHRVGLVHTIDEGDHVHNQVYAPGVLGRAGVFSALGIQTPTIGF